MIMTIPMKKEAFIPKGPSERMSLQRPIIQAYRLASGRSKFSAERTAKMRKRSGFMPRNPIWLNVVLSRIEMNSAQAMKITNRI